MLSEVMTRINAMENRTGIDFRKFEHLAVGIKAKQISPTEIDFEPVAIASGDGNAAVLASVSKLAASGKYREEKIGTRTVYIISPKVVAPTTPVTPNNSKIAAMIDKGLNSLAHEVAVTTLDQNTLVLGSLPRVRETLEAASHIAPEISSLLSVRETSIMSFAFKPVGGMSKMLPLDNDMLGSNIDSIQFMFGSLDITTSGANLAVAARTAKPQQAQDLKDTVEFLSKFGSSIFGSSKRTDQQVYGRMLKNAKFATKGNDLTFDLLVPQSDIDILIAGIK
jgi:hypothetical protein